MKREKGQKGRGNKGGKGKSGGVEYCGGFVDEYTIWNNGFYCPKWGGPDERYCCGSATKRFCCPEPEPVEPVDYDKHKHELDDSIPLIAGVSSAVVLIAVVLISCFVCRCCPAYKRIKRTRANNNNQTVEVRCSRCHATTTNLPSASGDDTLACGCPIGGPSLPHHHSHSGGSSERDSVLVPNTPDLLTLFENPNAGWQTGLELGELTEFPLDDPPPYRESDLDAIKAGGGDRVSLKSLEDDETTPLNTNSTFRLSNPNLLCMSSFRPLSPLGSGGLPGGMLMSPSSPLMTSTSPTDQLLMQLATQAAAAENSKRDSGCIEEDQQLYMEDEAEDVDAPGGGDDHDASIVVPKFHFQSLTLCRSLNNGGGSVGRHVSQGEIDPLDPETFGLHLHSPTMTSPRS